MTKKKKSNGTFVFGVIVAGLGVVGYGAGPGGWFDPEEVAALEGVPVRRGPLRISEVARGNLEAKDSARMVNELEGRTTIIFLAEEGTYVEEGQLICELDVSDLVDRMVSQEISVKNAEASFTKAREQYDIQEIQNTSDIAAAELAKKLADMDLEKFEPKPSGEVSDIVQGGEWTNDLASAEEKITLAAETLAQAESNLNFSEKLEELGFVQRTKLDEDRLAKQRAEIQLEQAQREYKLMLDFEHDRRLAELQADAETAERDIAKTEKQANAKLADFLAEKLSSEFVLKREEDQLEKMQDQISKATILAPESGMLVYGRRKSSRGMGGGEVPQEGGEVHERQEIATIPRAGGMIADVSLHETKLENVRVGQRCVVNVDALPGQIFEGEVAFLAAVADSGSWMTNPNQRLYKTEVSLTGVVPEMRPGMSCNIEILIDDLEDVLFVPRQAVFLDGDRTVVFVSVNGKQETREVEVGQDNNRSVEIRSGIEEGDIVLLSPPPGWEPAAASDPESLIKAVDPGPESVGATQRGKQGDRGGDRGDRGGDRGGDRREGSSASRGAGGMGGLSPELLEKFKQMRESGERPSPEQLQELMKDMSPEMRKRMEGMGSREGSRSRGGDQ